MVSSKTNEWATPQDFFNILDDEFCFNLDPCCTEENRKCENYFTIKQDGLSRSWDNRVVFMNPPYGGHTGEWLKKAYESSLRGATVVCLIVSSTDRSYWHELIFPYASQIRFIRGRLKFGLSKSTAPFASAVIVFSKKKYENRIIYDKREVQP